MTLLLACPLWSDVPSVMTSLCLSPSVWWEKELCSVSHCKDVPMTHPCWYYSRWKSDSPRIMISPITRAMKWTDGSKKGTIKTFNEISRIIKWFLLCRQNLCSCVIANVQIYSSSWIIPSLHGTSKSRHTEAASCFLFAGAHFMQHRVQWD